MSNKIARIQKYLKKLHNKQCNTITSIMHDISIQIQNNRTIIESNHIRSEPILLSFITTIFLREVQDMRIGTFIQQVFSSFLELPLHTIVQSSLAKLINHVYFCSSVDQSR